MKEFEVIVANLDEQNINNNISKKELDIMLECDDYNDMMHIANITQYDVLIEDCNN